MAWYWAASYQRIRFICPLLGPSKETFIRTRLARFTVKSVVKRVAEMLRLAPGAWECGGRRSGRQLVGYPLEPYPACRQDTGDRGRTSS